MQSACMSSSFGMFFDCILKCFSFAIAEIERNRFSNWTFYMLDKLCSQFVDFTEPDAGADYNHVKCSGLGDGSLRSHTVQSVSSFASSSAHSGGAWLGYIRG